MFPSEMFPLKCAPEDVMDGGTLSPWDILRRMNFYVIIVEVQASLFSSFFRIECLVHSVEMEWDAVWKGYTLFFFIFGLLCLLYFSNVRCVSISGPETFSRSIPSLKRIFCVSVNYIWNGFQDECVFLAKS